jgi:hypothetical protein
MDGTAADKYGSPKEGALCVGKRREYIIVSESNSMGGAAIHTKRQQTIFVLQ